MQNYSNFLSLVETAGPLGPVTKRKTTLHAFKIFGVLALLVSTLGFEKSALSYNGKWLIAVGATAFTDTGLKFRAEPKADGKELGTFKANDVVEMVNLLDSTTAFAQVKVLKNADKSLLGTTGFVNGDYIFAKQLSFNDDPTKYFMVQNIKTEKIRVYERCVAATAENPSCNHKLILEDDMVPGRNKGLFDGSGSGGNDEFYTMVGVVRIDSWVKFYRDENGEYPSWYDPKLEKVPPPRAGWSEWMIPSPNHKGQESMRGAFGWFTALTGPNTNGQWVHGTIGWGTDQDSYIKAAIDNAFSVFVDARSHGCTRVQNGLIAYLRDLLPVGSEILRVYADEEMKFSKNARLKKPKTLYTYILTKEDVRKRGGRSISQEAVFHRNVAKSDWLEAGDYYINSNPSVADGNIYGVSSNDIHGYLNVDTGKFSGYRHPGSLKSGGFSHGYAGSKYPLDLPDYAIEK